MKERLIRKVCCALCGTSSLQTLFCSLPSEGPSDLDSRPPEWDRSVLPHLVQRCHHCGYTAPDITKGEERLFEIWKSGAPLLQQAPAKLPEEALAFLRWSALAEKAGKLVDAAWGVLWGAWICDDHNLEGQQRELRKRAFQLFLPLWERRVPFGPDRETERLLLIDLLRRCRRFAEARAASMIGLETIEKEPWRALFLFEAHLCENNDDGPHTFEEALEGPA